MNTRIAIDKEKLIMLQNERGIIQTNRALKAGVHPRNLYELRESGVIEPISRGFYRFVDSPPLSNPDLVTVALRKPRAVICLVSALAFHELTTQVPHAVDMAILRGDITPRIDYPPVNIYRFSSTTFKAGIEIHVLDGIQVKIFNPEKTLADCVKFRNQIGVDIMLEALKSYRLHKHFNLEKLMHYASLCRVKNIIKPYLEVLL